MPRDPLMSFSTDLKKPDKEDMAAKEGNKKETKRQINIRRQSKETLREPPPGELGRTRENLGEPPRRT